MSASLASFQARLDTFSSKQKTRRGSRTTKKPPSKIAAWPHQSPAPTDLAFAGFIFKPNPSSPDNVQCVTCHRQLDGWEPTDNPTYEHLTHSPNCGFAINACIRLRNGDPNRVEEDPLSEKMVEARANTFGDFWPLDTAAGFPSVQQLAEAGWCYDPSPEQEDGVTCPYCSLSLDGWDAGDSPFEEHQRRASDCLFFALKELYHPSAIPYFPKAKGKRASTRSSTATSKKPKAAAKASAKSTRGKKTGSHMLEPESSIMEPSTTVIHHEPTVIHDEPPVIPKRSKRVSTQAVASTASTVIHNEPSIFPKRSKRVSTQSVASTTSTRRTRGIKATNDDMDQPQKTVKAPKTKKTLKAQETTQTKRTKRKSEHIEEPHVVIEPPKAKRAKRISDAPAPAPEPESPYEEPSSESPFSHPSLCITGTPPYSMNQEPTTPEQKPEHKSAAMDWEPVDIEKFLDNENKGGMHSFIQELYVDAHLDKSAIDSYMREASAAGKGSIVDAVKARLSKMEKKMTVEQWVLYNAQRGEQLLRAECEELLSAFDSQARRALAAIDSLPVIESY
ncbi:hypothetical protein BCR34DRAFT_617663 [Clohesyomyces aquaticus]|uniref:Inhibitor of apoptosis repeat-containing protein n=1 Tax=Clohesyomyces aquaticus TaxID=1231657 RepID=A0A1Y1Z0X6_9PLEO|nr:hypothetical protein BCR34DRAFT_617663 [Clohesyomyces aquaticus]